MAPKSRPAEPGERKPRYEPRRAAEALLYSVVSDRLASFLARTEERGGRVPRFVEREFRSFLQCGIPAHGFLRVRCDDCKLDRVVPFSCKGRGFCPSCGGRRMADTAAHLVDRVLPKAPVRQWVLSLPFALRYRLAYDAGLSAEILRPHVRTIFASYRRRARRKRTSTRLQAGAVTFIQRFGDAFNLNLHFHTLALDGGFEATEDGRFRALPPPDDAEVERVAPRIARGLRRLLERRGLGPHDDPELAALYSASVRGKISEGPHRGQQVLRFGDRILVDTLPGMAKVTPRCAAVAGLSLHANVAIPGRDRASIERLCRYAARPPVATERLERLPDGRLLYRLRHRFRDGTTHVVFEPTHFVAKLAALVPPPRFHMVPTTGSLRPPRGGGARRDTGRGTSEPPRPRRLGRTMSLTPAGTLGRS